ncbi:MAG: hypothetical protein ACRD0G_14715, partial [Acidimicrobiales bacterium]
MEMKMEITREVELDATVAEVWDLLSDVDALASWVGDDVRAARLTEVEDGHRVAWRWAPDGRESSVELTVESAGDRTRLRVVERGAGAGSGARACALGDAWDDRL